jgi:hypothetical protein
MMSKEANGRPSMDSPDYYLDAAQRYVDEQSASISPYQRKAIRHFRREVGNKSDVYSHVVTWLLDRSNWVAARPALELNAHVNQRGNLTVRLRPVAEPSFDPRLIAECMSQSEPVGNYRPLDELMWVREFGPWLGAGTEDDQNLRRLLLQAVKAAYEGLLIRLGEQLEVRRYTPFESLAR